MTPGFAGPGFGFWLTGKLRRACHRCMGSGRLVGVSDFVGHLLWVVGVWGGVVLGGVLEMTKF